jgi:branched-subunit amino acid aminotransferase/4-amino-4-deoxychorismate lyase
MLFYEGKLLFFNDHLVRLIKGASFLFPLCDWQNHQRDIFDYVQSEVKKLSKGNYYCRLTIVDDFFFMTIKEHVVSDRHVSLLKAIQVKTPSLRPSFLKLSQYADSFLELRQASLSHADDVLFFDNNNYVTEATTSNVFIVKINGEIVTPALSSMVLEGVLRSQLIQQLHAVETIITENDLLQAKEIWLTNSIKGIRLVNCYQHIPKIFKNSLYESTLEKFGRYGEKYYE